MLLQGAKHGGGGLPVRLTNGILLLGVQSVRAHAPRALFRSGGLLSCTLIGSAVWTPLQVSCRACVAGVARQLQ